MASAKNCVVYMDKYEHTFQASKDTFPCCAN